MEKNIEICLLLDFYGQLLTSRQEEIMNLYYNNDLSLGEIAENLGITRQGVHDNIKRSEKTLIEMESRLGIVKRFKENKLMINSAVENINLAEEEIRNKKYDLANKRIKEIKNTLQKIIEE